MEALHEAVRKVCEHEIQRHLEIVTRQFRDEISKQASNFDSKVEAVKIDLALKLSQDRFDEGVRGLQAEMADLRERADGTAMSLKEAVPREEFDRIVQAAQRNVEALQNTVDQSLGKLDDDKAATEQLTSSVAILTAGLQELRGSWSRSVPMSMFDGALAQIQGDVSSVRSMADERLAKLEESMLDGLEGIKAALDHSVTEKQLDARLAGFHQRAEKALESALEQTTGIQKCEADIMAFKAEVAELKASLSKKLSEVQLKTVIARFQDERDDIRKVMEDTVTHKELEASIPKILEAAEMQTASVVDKLEERILSVHNSVSDMFTTIEGIQFLVTKTAKAADSPGSPGPMARIG